MLELNQFRHSASCLKIRMVLAAKKLNYRIVEITPGIGQVDIFKLSGQRKVPVLVDGNNIIADSKAIVRHIEVINPEPQLIPKDPKEAASVVLIEDWADTTFAKAAKSILIQSASIDEEIRGALLPEEMPPYLRRIIKDLPTQIIGGVSEFFNQGKCSNLISNLEKLSMLVANDKWIVGNSISIADISVAAQLSLLRFPSSSGPELCGKGCPGFYDNPNLKSLFDWRDKLEDYLKESSPFPL